MYSVSPPLCVTYVASLSYVSMYLLYGGKFGQMVGSGAGLVIFSASCAGGRFFGHGST